MGCTTGILGYDLAELVTASISLRGSPKKPLPKPAAIKLRAQSVRGVKRVAQRANEKSFGDNDTTGAQIAKRTSAQDFM